MSVYRCPRGSQLMIRVFEDLNLGIYLGILGFFWDFGTFFEILGLFGGFFWDLFSNFVFCIGFSDFFRIL